MSATRTIPTRNGWAVSISALVVGTVGITSAMAATAGPISRLGG